MKFLKTDRTSKVAVLLLLIAAGLLGIILIVDFLAIGPGHPPPSSLQKWYVPQPRAEYAENGSVVANRTMDENLVLLDGIEEGSRRQLVLRRCRGLLAGRGGALQAPAGVRERLAGRPGPSRRTRIVTGRNRLRLNLRNKVRERIVVRLLPRRRKTAVPGVRRLLPRLLRRIRAEFSLRSHGCSGIPHAPEFPARRCPAARALLVKQGINPAVFRDTAPSPAFALNPLYRLSTTSVMRCSRNVERTSS
jgi:hypothetical protein